MTKAAVANDIKNDIFVEFLAELGGNARCMNHGFRIVAVHVENRRLDHQRNVSGVGARAAEVRCGCKADLVVHNDVHGATCLVTLQAGKTEPFGNDTLASEGRAAGLP